ncbi:MAG TPA: glycine/sarcosine/betaine reductase component B subunit [Candidatus Limnocylindria bacterium]
MTPKGPRLERRSFDVRDIGFGRGFRYEDGRLQVDRDALASAVLLDDRVARCEVQLVSPGEDARIVHICDTAEPQWRVDGQTFGGWLSPIRTAGDGVTHRLAGAGVTVACELPWRKTGGIQTPRESIAEMRGPLAALNPLSRLRNVVLEIELREGLPDEECDRATHVAEFRAAELLAREATRDREPTSVELFELGEADPSLPRVAYVYQITSQGPYAGTFLYGGYLDRLMPTIVHPNEILDGALVDGNVAGPWIRTPTIVHQNNPIITGLYRDHGRDLRFAGVVLLRGHYYGMDDKYRVAQETSKLVRWLGADGAIFTWENAGNGIMECLYALQECERLGVKSVFLTWEHGGAHGDDTPLQFYVPEADAIVSTGSMDEPVVLPEVARVVGGDTVRLNPQTGGERRPAKGPIELSWRLELYGGAGHVGETRYGRVDA